MIATSCCVRGRLARIRRNDGSERIFGEALDWGLCELDATFDALRVVYFTYWEIRESADLTQVFAFLRMLGGPLHRNVTETRTNTWHRPPTSR